MGPRCPNIPFAPIRWRFRGISAVRTALAINRAPLPKNRPVGESADIRHLQDSPMILRYRPRLSAVRNAPLSPQVGGGFLGYAIGQGSTGPDIPFYRPKYVGVSRNFGRYSGIGHKSRCFQEPPKILRDRPMINEVRNSSLSTQLGGVARNFCRSS